MRNFMASELKVDCPKCKKNFSYYSSKFRPFCSERCKLVDLDNWLEENYAVPAEEADDPLEEDEREYGYES